MANSLYQALKSIYASGEKYTVLEMLKAWLDITKEYDPSVEIDELQSTIDSFTTHHIVINHADGDISGTIMFSLSLFSNTTINTLTSLVNIITKGNSLMASGSIYDESTGHIYIVTAITRIGNSLTVSAVSETDGSISVTLSNDNVTAINDNKIKGE